MIQSENILASGEQILRLLPHRHPMIMIDKLIVSDDESTVTCLTISEDNVFSHEGLFTEPGLVENIAQTAAIRAGYSYQKEGKGTPMGYIGAVKHLDIHFLPKVNSEISTEIRVENEVFDVSLIRGTVMCEGRLVAECEMKIVLKR
jgi:3-hydroxyacyl-[acyl-carrier-protein] dehydratase